MKYYQCSSQATFEGKTGPERYDYLSGIQRGKSAGIARFERFKETKIAFFSKRTAQFKVDLSLRLRLYESHTENVIIEETINFNDKGEQVE